MTPDQVLDLLREGNRAFLEDRLPRPTTTAVSVVDENMHFPGNIGKMIQPIISAVLEAADQPGRLETAVRQNTMRVVREMREDAAPMVLAAQAAGLLKVVGAYYYFTTGEVGFFDMR